MSSCASGRRQQLSDTGLCGLERGVVRVTAVVNCWVPLAALQSQLVMVLKYSLLSCTIKKTKTQSLCFGHLQVTALEIVGHLSKTSLSVGKK